MDWQECTLPAATAVVGMRTFTLLVASFLAATVPTFLSAQNGQGAGRGAPAHGPNAIVGRVTDGSGHSRPGRLRDSLAAECVIAQKVSVRFGAPSYANRHRWPISTGRIGVRRLLRRCSTSQRRSHCRAGEPFRLPDDVLPKCDRCCWRADSACHGHFAGSGRRDSRAGPAGRHIWNRDRIERAGGRRRPAGDRTRQWPVRVGLGRVSPSLEWYVRPGGGSAGRVLPDPSRERVATGPGNDSYHSQVKVVVGDSGDRRRTRYANP